MHATVTRRSLGDFLGLGLPAPAMALPSPDPIFSAIETHREVAREEASTVSALARLSPRAQPHGRTARRDEAAAQAAA